MRTRLTRLRRIVCTAAFLFAPVVAACGQEQAQLPSVSGNPQNGRQLIQTFGCGACHTIPGIDGADSLVGPPLVAWKRRIYIAGLLRNTPDSLATWIEHPQKIVPGNAMPDMGISPRAGAGHRRVPVYDSLTSQRRVAGGNRWQFQRFNLHYRCGAGAVSSRAGPLDS
jgi:cytochrome c